MTPGEAKKVNGFFVLAAFLFLFILVGIIGINIQQSEVRHQRTKDLNRQKKLSAQRDAAVAEVERLRTIFGIPPTRNDDPWRK